MRVVLNGDPRVLTDGASVRDAVVAAGAPEEGRGVAVALDGEVVPRAEWHSTQLNDGGRVEILNAVQGG